METVAKGLHGINAKVPELTLRRDMLSFALQLGSLFMCVLSVMLWVIFGFDSTIDGVSRFLIGKTPIDMGNGTHWSTVLNVFLIIFLVSNYLSIKGIKAFHNAIISIFTAIVAIMVYEFAWFIMNDAFHSDWKITTFGIGNINFGMLAIGAAIIPTAIFYFAFVYAHGNLPYRNIMPFSAFVYLFVLIGFVVFSLLIGTLSVLIRNTFALMFVAFDHAAITDATKNWKIQSLIGKYKIEWRKKLPALLLIAGAAVMVVWVFWPYATNIQGAYFPQTVYAFYKANGDVSHYVYVANAAVHAFNVMSKALVSAAIALLIVPRIQSDKK